MGKELLEIVVSVLIAVIASSGFWAYMSKRAERKDSKTQLLLGLAHDRIMALGNEYIERGYITPDEYENLYEYLYKPYETSGGNGTAKQIMGKVKLLPIKSHP